MRSRSTSAKIGLVVLVIVAGLTAVGANFEILAARRSSPEVGVLSVTDVSATVTPDPAPAAVVADAVAGVETTTTTSQVASTDASRDKHDGDHKRDGDRDHDGDRDDD